MRRDKEAGFYYYIEAEPFVIIFAIDDKLRVKMVKTWRYPIKRYNWEFPMGWVEKNESPLIAAKRELHEEAGIKAKKWKRLTWFYLAPGISRQKGFIYVAHDLTKDRKKLDKEIIESKTYTIRQIRQMIKKRKIVDAPTLLAANYLFEYTEDSIQ